MTRPAPCAICADAPGDPGGRWYLGCDHRAVTAVLRHIQQPEGSRLCGASCVAMVLGIPPAEAIERIGHERGVRNWEVVAALGLEGRFKRAPRDPARLPTPSILRLRWEPGSRHHLVVYDGKVFDPSYALPAPGIAEWSRFVSLHGGRVVSYLPLPREAWPSVEAT